MDSKKAIDILSRLAAYFLKTKGAGHTKAVCSAGSHSNALIYAADYMSLAGRVPAKFIVTPDNIKSRLEQHNMPLVLDHFAVMDLFKHLRESHRRMSLELLERHNGKFSCDYQSPHFSSLVHSAHIVVTVDGVVRNDVHEVDIEEKMVKVWLPMNPESKQRESRTLTGVNVTVDLVGL